MYFDFRCKVCENVFERFVKPDKKVFCPKCAGSTKRLISAPRIVGNGLDPSMPTAYAKWEKINKQKTAEDKKFYERHGVDKKHHSVGS